MSTSDLTCSTCGIEAPYREFEDCIKCTVAVAIHKNLWGEMLRWYGNATWFPPLQREFDRQASAHIQSGAQLAPLETA